MCVCVCVCVCVCLYANYKIEIKEFTLSFSFDRLFNIKRQCHLNDAESLNYHLKPSIKTN